MRHLVKGKKLGRSTSHRKATLQALAVSLIQERRIVTTVAKAKELRRFIEPLITRAKVDSTHNRRKVFARLNDKYAVTELFEEVGPRAKERPGGYTRVVKTGFRQGDSAELAMIELVDYNDVQPEKADGKKKRTRRAGRSRSGAAAPAAGKAAEVKENKAAEASNAEGPAGSVESSKDFNVDEVKQKLESMTPEEAQAFVADDERVTVKKALEKKLREQPEEASQEEE